MHDTNSLTDTATTRQERSGRITAIIHGDASEMGVQVLAEIAAKTIAEQGTDAVIAAVGNEEHARQALALSAKIAETFEPEVPDFECGETVALFDGSIRGKIRSRYLSESGGWEYSVSYRHAGQYKEDPFSERHLNDAARKVGA